MSDIDWSVKSGIIDDERKLTFSYKNNTDYTIAYIELTFTRKDSVSDQEMLNAFKQYENDDYSKNDIKKLNIVTESYINGHQMIWRKKLQNQISIVLWLIAMIM